MPSWTMSLSLVPMPTLTALIALVIQMSAKEQVVGVNATPHIALMKDEYSCWHRSDKKAVRDSMSRAATIFFTSKGDLAIAPMIHMTGPDPATGVGFWHYTAHEFCQMIHSAPLT